MSLVNELFQQSCNNLCNKNRYKKVYFLCGKTTIMLYAQKDILSIIDT